MRYCLNHKYALDYILRHLSPMTEDMILDIGKLINKNINEIDGYRKIQVFIQGASHIPPKPQMIKQQMMYFIQSYHQTVFDDIFQKIATLHINFEKIHPFSDGNGRTGRLLMWHELLRNDYAPAILTAERKIEYLHFLEEQDFLGLGNMLRHFSEEEEKRMNLFTEEHPPDK